MLDPLDDLQTALEGRYAIEREIGHGGMAVVYRARDLRHDRTVALKVLQPGFSANLGAERFLREIDLSRGPQHPPPPAFSIPATPVASLYYVMPCIDDGSLRDLLKQEDRSRRRGRSPRAGSGGRPRLRAPPGRDPPGHQAREHPAEEGRDRGRLRRGPAVSAAARRHTESGSLPAHPRT